MLKSSGFSILLALTLIGVLLFQGLQIHTRLLQINELAQIKSKQREKPKAKPKTQDSSMNLEKACEEMNGQTQKCLKDAHACLDVLGSFNEKNKVFEKKVQQCQDRNNKNSERNDLLKNRLDEVTLRMNSLKNKENVMEL